MNVLFLSELLYPHGSGAELATYLYADLLSKSNFNVRIVTNKFVGEEAFSRIGHFEIYRLPMFKNSDGLKYSILMRIDVLFSTFLRKMLKWADVVYIPRFWFSAIPLAKAQGKPVISHVHDYIPVCPLESAYDTTRDALCKGNKLFCSPKCAYLYEKVANRPLKETLASVTLNSTFGGIFSRMIGLSDVIICVSEAQRSIISKSNAFHSDKLFTVYNPVPDYPNLPVKGDDFGYFGGLVNLKGFQVLYDAVVSVNSVSSNPVRIHCTKFSRIKRNCADVLTQAGFSLYGKLETEKYDEVYKNISCVVVPSLWPEPWPYVVVEALLRGRLVIASRIGGIPEQLKGCQGITLVEAGNFEMLKRAMIDVTMQSRETISEIGSKNRDTFRKRFSNESSLKHFAAILENAVL
jgi:glycosyltransferase involved in cell wall biosynthesis